MTRRLAALLALNCALGTAVAADTADDFDILQPLQDQPGKLDSGEPFWWRTNPDDPDHPEISLEDPAKA